MPILERILIVGLMTNPCYWDKICNCDRKKRSLLGFFDCWILQLLVVKFTIVYFVYVEEAIDL